jgi:uncharacterized protein
VTSPSDSHRARPPAPWEAQASKFRILSIDGGGIRGLIPAIFLAELEGLLKTALDQARSDSSKAQGARRWDGIDEPRIADCFHLIAGTSTGGVLAAALTVTDSAHRPRLSAAAAAALYESRGAEIFRRPPLRDVLDHFNLFVPKYPLAQLRSVLEDPSGLGTGLLKDARTEILITSFDTDLPGPRFFTRWGAPGAGTSQAEPSETMVEAALGTSAAPTYFEPEKLDSAHFVDGGVYAGNPALAAISMALRRTVAPAPLTPADLLLISLGTGAWEEALDYGWGGILGWLWPRTGGEALLEALLGGQGDFATEAAHMILNGVDATLLPGGAARAGAGGPAWWEPNLPPASVGAGPRFWRYQAQLPAPWALDDASKIPQLRQVGIDLARRYRAELEALAELLIEAGPVPP